MTIPQKKSKICQSKRFDGGVQEYGHKENVVMVDSQ